MSPLLEDGKSILVRSQRSYWPGDVLAFVCPRGLLVVHRLLGYRPRRGRVELVTRGDAADSTDVPIPRARVIGRVVGGDCSSEVYRVPWAQRFRAGLEFLRLTWRKVLGK